MNISYDSQIQQDSEPREASYLANEAGEVQNLEVSDSFRYIHHCVCDFNAFAGFNVLPKTISQPVWWSLYPCSLQISNEKSSISFKKLL